MMIVHRSSILEAKCAIISILLTLEKYTQTSHSFRLAIEKQLTIVLKIRSTLVLIQTYRSKNNSYIGLSIETISSQKSRIDFGQHDPQCYNVITSYHPGG